MLAALPAAGCCRFSSNGPLAVTGTLVSADGSAPDKCELRLLRPGEDEPVQTLVVSAQVRDAFDVPACQEDWRFQLVCAAHEMKEYGPVRASSRTFPPSRPMLLGRVVLQPAPPGP